MPERVFLPEQIIFFQIRFSKQNTVIFDYKEDYYYTFLAGLFAGAGYAVESNHECRSGRSDLVVRDRKDRRIIMSEIKRSKSERQMLHDCRMALRQMNIWQCAYRLLKGYPCLICYSIAFFIKECLLKKWMKLFRRRSGEVEVRQQVQAGSPEKEQLGIHFQTFLEEII